MPARNLQKAHRQRLMLAGPEPAKTQRASTLLVCGTKIPDDGWMFSDFFGLWKAFQAYGTTCELLSCFDLKKHFDILKDKGVKSNNIKFGKHQDHRFIYEKPQFEQCPPWWKQIAPERLLHEVEFWIGKARRNHRADDVVNLVFLCHGSEDGDFALGSNNVSATDIIKKTKKFKSGVQVNVISGACFSGILCDKMEESNQTLRYVTAASNHKQKSYSTSRSISGRHRSGRFVDAFVESLLKPISDPEAFGSWTVQNHEDHILFRSRNITPRHRIIFPQFSHAGFDPTTMRLKELFLRNDQASPLHSPPSSSASHTDWNNATSVLHDTFTRTLARNPLDDDVPASALEVAKKEGDLCWLDSGDPPDMGIFNELFCPQTNWFIVLTNMYWRSFRQTAIWEIYLRLLAKRIVNTESLVSPIDLVEATSNSHCISRLLGCFKFLATQSEEALQGKIPGQSSPWTADTRWLGTIIVRSGSDVDSVIAEIKDSKILGELRHDKISRWRADYSEVNVLHNTQDGEGALEEDGLPAPENNTFAFWLPHGLTDDPQIQHERLHRCYNRAKAIETAFMQVETLPVGIIILELGVFGLGSESGATSGDEVEENLEDDTEDNHSGEDHNHEKDKPGEYDDPEENDSLDESDSSGSCILVGY
ncbi:hypothetical protein N7540_003091 [Penicillium herquei]|nr:hypothetical protein N7540_003091 [Penicillium herquei]